MSNVLTAVTPRLLASGLMALRQNAVMPRLVNSSYSTMAGQQGSTIDVPIPAAIAAQAVSPAATPPSTAAVTPAYVAIPMDQWYEAPFFLDDQDLMKVMNGFFPLQASEAVKALANNVDLYLHSLTKNFYGYIGTAGTTPFASNTNDITNARKVLHNQLAPVNDRRLVLNPDAEANALALQAFQNTQWRGDTDGIREGMLGRKFGFDIDISQNYYSHTAGTAAAATVTLISNSAAGVSSVTLKVASGTATLVVGDIISFANHSQTYVVTAAATLDTTGVVVSIAPTLQVATNGSGTPVAVTVRASHVVNPVFHRDAIAFATRPLSGANTQGLGVITQSVVDEVSGLTLRLEITREHKRNRFAYDILYGGAVIRRELGARLAG